MATYTADPFTAVPAVGISPSLVALTSPANPLSIDIRPRGEPSEAAYAGRGLSFTANVPVARVVTVAPLNGRRCMGRRDDLVSPRPHRIYDLNPPRPARDADASLVMRCCPFSRA